MDPKNYKQQLLNQLYEPYKKCLECPLGSLGRTTVVFGEGNPDARLMFVGEGPGKEEDEQGRPFIGRSGQLLNRTIESIGIKRQDIFITNVVKCRPPGNRKPLPIESQTCKNLLLLNQIKIIRPKVICTLGSAAIQGLLEKEIKITRIRGIRMNMGSIIILPTYHPAYVLRNPKMQQIFTQDIQTALEYTSFE